MRVDAIYPQRQWWSVLLYLTNIWRYFIYCITSCSLFDFVAVVCICQATFVIKL
jgi:hypothetical protein